jgi:hypothetical protein
MKNERSDSRREFVKKAAYVVPAILTLQAAPAYVKASSDHKPNKPEKEPKPKKIELPKPKKSRD